MNTDLDEQRLRRLGEAAEWLQRLQAAPNERLRCQFSDWCHEDPRNLEAFGQLSQTWAGFEPRPSVVATSRPRRWLAAAACVLLTLSLGGGWLAAEWPREHRYHSPTGHNQSVLLSDGSRIEIGGDSRVEVRYTRRERGLKLLQGEAYFTVAPGQPKRPFVVRSGSLWVTALGTEFNIRRSQDASWVTVGEGRVAIAADDPVTGFPLAAVAGDRVSWLESARQITVSQVDPASAADWRYGRLSFIAEPLAGVIEELNRYSPRPITLADRSLASLPFTGTIAQDRVDEWLLVVQKIMPVSVVDQGEAGLLLKPRAKSRHSSKAIGTEP